MTVLVVLLGEITFVTFLPIIFLVPGLVALILAVPDFFAAKGTGFFVTNFLTNACGLGVGVEAKLDVPGASRAAVSRIAAYRHLQTMKVFCRIGAWKG